MPMPSRFLKVSSSEISQFVIPCTEKKCSGETLIDLTVWRPVPKNDEPLSVQCSLCNKVIQPPATYLLRVLLDNLNNEPSKPLFYFLVPEYALTGTVSPVKPSFVREVKYEKATRQRFALRLVLNLAAD
jgi:hypothetical protein